MCLYKKRVKGSFKDTIGNINKSVLTNKGSTTIVRSRFSGLQAL